MPSSSDKAYAARFQIPDDLERGTLCTVRCPVYRDGVLVAPSAGTVEFRDPAGAVVFTAESLVILDAGDDADVPSYTFTPAADLALAEGYRLIYTTTIAGKAYVFENDAAIVRRRLVCPIADPDLVRVDSLLDPTANDALTKRVTSWQEKIDEAFVQVQLRLRERGNRPHLIASPSSLREVLILLTRALIYEDFGKRQPVWTDLAKRLRDDFEARWKTLQFPYADPESTPPAGVQPKRAASPVLTLGTRRGGWGRTR